MNVISTKKQKNKKKKEKKNEKKDREMVWRRPNVDGFNDNQTIVKHGTCYVLADRTVLNRHKG